VATFPAAARAPTPRPGGTVGRRARNWWVTTAVVVAVVAAAIRPAEAAQGKGGGAKPGGVTAAALDWARSVDPFGGPFERVDDPRGLKNLNPTVARRVSRLKYFFLRYEGQFFSVEPCPDVHGTARATGAMKVRVLGPGEDDGDSLWSSTINFDVRVDVDDNAAIENVIFEGGYGESDGPGADIFTSRANKEVEATVTGKGRYKKSTVQQGANTVAKRAAALANAIAKKLEAVWQDGKTCVTLGVTPGSKAVKPKEELQIDVDGTAKDGNKITRPITAKLDGATSIKPTTAPKAPGSFKYISPAKRNQKGHITFEQRSKRGIGRAEVEYVVGGKWKFDFSATKVPERCLSQLCDHASLAGLSATIELGADGTGTGSGVATVSYTSESTIGFSLDPEFVPGHCNATNSYPVPMTITVQSVGETLTVSAISDTTAFQSCSANGPIDLRTRVVFNPVSVPAKGGTNGTTAGANTSCLLGSFEIPQVVEYSCTFTLTATEESD
jgi:hypothetical protein